MHAAPAAQRPAVANRSASQPATTAVTATLAGHTVR